MIRRVVFGIALFVVALFLVALVVDAVSDFPEDEVGTVEE